MKFKLKSFLTRFLLFNLFFGIFVGISIRTTIKPIPYYKYSDNDWDALQYSPSYNQSEWNVLLDGHSHTYYSDGELSPRQNILWHISLGYNAMVLTDHNRFDSVFEIRDIARNEFNNSIKILLGVEWTTDRGHYNLIFPPNTTLDDFKDLIPSTSYAYDPTDEEIEAVFNETHELGGIVVVNHFFWSSAFGERFPTMEQLDIWGVDYFEIVNGDEYYEEPYQYCLENGLGMITGSDMHIPDKTYSWTKLKIDSFSEDEIFEQLIKKNTSILYNKSGSPYGMTHKFNIGYDLMIPFIAFGQVLKDIYSDPHYIFQYIVFFS
ncbi:MAG: PHP domain-containing protein, partial [Promethearchaeota archaeon]